MTDESASFENGSVAADGTTGRLVESNPPALMAPPTVTRRRRPGNVNALPTKAATPGARCPPRYRNSCAPARVTRVSYAYLAIGNTPSPRTKDISDPCERGSLGGFTDLGFC